MPAPWSMVPGVLLGGALGALCRYLVALAFQTPNPVPFPLATLTVNVVGSFLLSLLLFAHPGLPTGVRLAIGTGFLGALTTFSTFEVETFSMLERGQWGLGLLYSVGSFALGLLAVLAGRWLAFELSR